MLRLLGILLSPSAGCLGKWVLSLSQRMAPLPPHLPLLITPARQRGLKYRSKEACVSRASGQGASGPSMTRSDLSRVPGMRKVAVFWLQPQALVTFSPQPCLGVRSSHAQGGPALGQQACSSFRTLGFFLLELLSASPCPGVCAAMALIGMRLLSHSLLFHG